MGEISSKPLVAIFFVGHGMVSGVCAFHVELCARVCVWLAGGEGECQADGKCHVRMTVLKGDPDSVLAPNLCYDWGWNLCPLVLFLV